MEKHTHNSLFDSGASSLRLLPKRCSLTTGVDVSDVCPRAMGNPYSSQTRHLLSTGEEAPSPSLEERLETLSATSPS